jgi:hypothetical protein
MLSPHETFTKATHLILFLRAEDWLSRFYAARVRLGRGGMSALSPFYPQLRTLLRAVGMAAPFIIASRPAGNSLRFDLRRLDDRPPLFDFGLLQGAEDI